MTFAQGLSALGHREFRLFFAGEFVSIMGSWMQMVGQSWLVLELGNSPFRLGLIGALQFLPTLLFSLPAGALLDRVPKRSVLLVTQTSKMFSALLLSALVLSDRVQFWQIAALAVLVGAANTIDTPARQSFIIEMVGRDDLMNAFALNSAMINGTRIFGPALAGLLIARLDLGFAFLVNGVSYLAVIGALLLIRAGANGSAADLHPPGRSAVRTPALGEVLRDVREGLTYVARRPDLTFLLGLLFFISLFVIHFPFLVPLLAKQMLKTDASGLGYLMSAMGGGAVIGALALAAKGRQRPPLGSLVTLAAILSGTTLAVGFVREFNLALAALPVIAFTEVQFLTRAAALLQVNTPDHLQGRVMSLHTLVFDGTVPVAALSLGMITERFGAAAGWWSGGGFGLLAVLSVALWWNLGGRPFAGGSARGAEGTPPPDR